MNVSTPLPLKLLTASTILYMLIALFAGLVASTQNLPGEFGGVRDGLTAAQDFLYGMGTAISPPLLTFIIQLCMLMLAPRKDRWGSMGVLGLAIIGLLTFIGALGEPINFKNFNPATLESLKGAAHGSGNHPVTRHPGVWPDGMGREEKGESPLDS